MEQILGQPVIANSTIVAFDIRILLRVAGLDKDKCNALFFGPVRQGGTDVFRSIITAYLERFPRHSMI